MSHHECPRCGVPLKWTHRSWPDKHPAAAVTAGLTTLVFMGMMLSVHPVAAAVIIGIAAAIAAARGVAAARRRREALAARADYENRKLMEASIKWPQQLAANPMTIAARSPLPADHWSPTEPMRTR